jgi:eukaryotic-like serine/threonine-protein kinase
MQEDRQSRIDQLVRSALAVEPEERASYLSEVCSDNDVLEEVTRTLAQLSASSENAATNLPNAAQQDVRIGESYGSYRVTRRIASGGMGEVYAAFDSRLGRQVALKFLPAHTASDEKLVRRFQLEARTASALNHPNILTIFDVGKFERDHYIASEFVDGTTVRVLLRRGRFDVAEALEIVTQVASALVAAHSAGVIHRDLKPTNIMVRPDGFIKVIDFGLAKRMWQSVEDPNGEPATKPGTMLGTADYMSPEQARGEEVDSRTDIWSLGVIFYEMLAGERPFRGQTEYHVIAHILENEPDPPGPAGTLPAEVEQILNRCLKKDREQRYESAAHLYADLKEARRALNLSSIASKPLVTLRKPRSTKWYWIPAAAMLLVAFAGAWWWNVWGRELLVGPEPFEYSEMKQLTYRGNVKLASISPDGRYLASVSGTPHHEELDVKPMDSNYDSTLVARSDSDYRGLTFSNDSQYIYFVTRTNEFGTLRKIAITGGDPQVIEGDVDGPVAVNPNGAEVAFRRNSSPKQYIVLTSGKFGGKEVLDPVETPRVVDNRVAWSPSHFQIAFFVYPSSSRSPMSLELLDAAARKPGREIEIPGWRAVTQPVWMANGKDLIVSVEKPGETENNMQLHEVSAVTGRTRSITAGPYGYHGAGLTRDGRQLVTVRLDRQTRFWFGEESDPRTGRVRWADSGQYDSVAWTDDGKLIAQANRGDGTNAWLIDLLRESPQKLTQGPSVNRDPVWLPHKQSIVFASERNDSYGIWRLDLNDGKYRLLASAPDYVEFPVCTPDGKTIIYTGWNVNEPSIWSVSTESGTEKPKLLLKNARYAVLSPDARYFAVEELVPGRVPGGWRVAVYDYPELKFVEAMPQIPAGSRLKWSPAGLGLDYIVTDDQGTSNIWRQLVGGGSAQRITSFEEDQIFDYSWSPDGTQLVCLRGRTLSDAFDLIRKP